MKQFSILSLFVSSTWSTFHEWEGNKKSRGSGPWPNWLFLG